MVSETLNEVQQLKEQLLKSAEKAKISVLSHAEETNPVQFLASVKFREVGYDPITGETINLIEQLNQLFSDLVAVSALEHLMIEYPEKVFLLHLGTEAGFDVESKDGEVAAECFAVTRVASNNKLRKDAEKLIKKAENKRKYIFFYSEKDKEDALIRIYEKYPDVRFIRIRNF